MSACIKLDQVSVAFGKHPDVSLRLLDNGRTREEAFEKTKQRVALYNCSAELPGGKISVVLGLQGAGKTSLLRALNGLQKIARGKITVNTQPDVTEVSELTSSQLRQFRKTHVALTGQGFGLFPRRTVRQNVSFALAFARMPGSVRHSKTSGYIGLLGLTDYAEQPLSKLSLALQRRVAIARAFAAETPIVVLDYPFEGLDPLEKQSLQKDILEIQADLNKTIVIATSDVSEAFQLADSLILLEEGQVIQQGTVQEVYANPAPGILRPFIKALNPLAIAKASDVMEPLSGHTRGSVEADQDLVSVMEEVADAKAPLAIVRQGEEVGEVSSGAILRWLSR